MLHIRMSPVERTDTPDPNRSPLYAGLSRARLEPERFDLGHGVVCSRTFAHIFAPYLMAFVPTGTAQNASSAPVEGRIRRICIRHSHPDIHAN